MQICAVILTHLRAPVYEHRVSVPYIVTTDNLVAATHHMWNARYVSVGLFENTERAIGAHMHSAIESAFATFPTCDAVSVLEDDVEVSNDYFDAARFAMDSGASCFTCINDRGDDSTFPWQASALRPVTYSVGIGMVLSRDLWVRTLNKTWGVGHWDNFLRTAYNMTCLAPEISRCRHHAHVASTHGVNGPALQLTKLPVFGIDDEAAVSISDFFVTPPATACSRGAGRSTTNAESHRGTYYGRDQYGCQVFIPPTESHLHYIWLHGKLAESCTSTCLAKNLACSSTGLKEPQWAFVARFTGCTHFGSEIGRELPSSIALSNHIVLCNVPFFNSGGDCTAWHSKTRRLCPCYKPTKHNAVYYV